MKVALFLSILVLPLACGEPRIKSVDEEVMNQANADKAAAELKLEQSLLLGVWQACGKAADDKFVSYEYGFAGDGQVSLLRQDRDNETCEGEPLSSERVDATYELIPVKEGKGFTLKLKWTDGKKLESQYRLNGNTNGDFPRFFELKDQKDLRLVELSDEKHFIGFKKVPADELPRVRKQAEAMTLDYARSLLRREGVWESACLDNRRVTLTFKTDKVITMKRSTTEYADKECEKAKEVKPQSVEAELTLHSVSDLQSRTIDVSIGEAKGQLKVAFDKFDQLELTVPELQNDKTTLFTLKAAGEDQ